MAENAESFRKDERRELRPEDFDGHTDFKKLTASEKLGWLSEMILFYHAAREVRARSRQDEGVEKLSDLESEKSDSCIL